MGALSFDDLDGTAPLSEDEAQGALTLASGGGAPVTVTSAYRTPQHNAAIGGAKNSMHTWGQGEAVDFQLPAGTDPNAVRAELQRQGYPVSEWLIEHTGDAHSTGPHIHWGWGQKGQPQAAQPATSGPVDFSDLNGGKGGPLSFADLDAPAAAPQKPGAMPNPIIAAVQGIISSGKDVAQAFTGQRQPDAVSPAAEPLHWRDALHPIDALSKLAYGFGASWPMMAGGVAGTVAGGAVPGGGETGATELIGGGIGATLGNTLQTLGPAYYAELKKTPKDTDGAFNRAIKDTGLDNASAGVSWAAFGYAPFKSQVKNLLLQAFAVQPGVSMATKAATNAQQGRPVTEGMSESYLQGAAGTIVPAAGHALASVALSRIGLHSQAAIAAAKAKQSAQEPAAASTNPVPVPNQDLLDMAAIPQPGRNEPAAAATPEAPGFSTNPAKIAQEHDLEVQQLSAQGGKAAAEKHTPEALKPEPQTEPGSIVESEPHLKQQQTLDERAGLPPKPADDDRQGWVDYTNKTYEAGQRVSPEEDPELFEHLNRVNSMGNYMVDKIDHDAQMARAEPVTELVLPGIKVGKRISSPIGRIRILQDPETGKFGVGTSYDLPGFAGGGGPVSGRKRLPFDFDSAQEALDYAKERLRKDPSSGGFNSAPKAAIRAAEALNNWLGGLQLPTPAAPETAPPTEGPPGQVSPTEVQPSEQKPSVSATPAAPAAPTAKPQQTDLFASDRFTEVGQSTDGHVLYEDKNGVRSYLENGVRHTEPVQLRPTRAGMQYVVDRGAHPDFATVDEAAALPPSLPPRVEEPPAPEHPNGIRLASAVSAFLTVSKKPLTAKDLQKMAEEIYGGTLADGKIPRDELYDAGELGINMFLRQYPSSAGHGPFSPAVDAGNAKARADYLEALKNRMPTQTVRAGEKETHQQFSTPTDYAYAATWAANLHPSDVVLEPSAGTGSFIAHALNSGAREVFANDLSDRRADMLRALGATEVTKENAENIDILLPESIKPTVVLMNPPFSQTAGRVGTKKVLGTDFVHVRAALRKLAPGGRLVAVMGGGAHPGNAGWRAIAKGFDIRANLGVEGAIYRKYGTTFPTRVVVIDKVAPSGKPRIEVEGLKSATEIIDALKDVRDERVHLAGEQQPTSQPAGEILAGQSEGAEQPSAPVLPAAGGLGPREGAAPEQPGGTAGPREPGEPAPRNPSKRGPRAKSGVGVAGEQPERPVAGGAGRDPGVVIAPGEGPLSGSDGGAGDGIRPDGSGQRDEPGVTEAPAVVKAAEQSLSQNVENAPLSEAVYEPYAPQRATVEGAKAHPGPLVQSAAMAAVEPPAPTHKLTIPKRVVESGALSDAQLEAVLYAGNAHEKVIEASGDMVERRRGFFIGDGTGVGKGREVAGIMLDNWQAGRRKHIWVSEKKPLINDAKRDLKGVSLDPKHVIDHGGVKAGEEIKAKEGVLFTTYDTLKSAEQIKQQAIDEKTGQPVSVKGRGKTRVQQIIDWVGPDFEGVIAFDEAHNLGNSTDSKGNRGLKKAAAKAIAGVELQNKLPKARVVYVSATGATEVSNLAYADRLGLWGRGTAFASRDDFVQKVAGGGVAAMELVARDMKAMGRYIARNLSYDGVEYDRVDHPLTPAQVDIYDKLADAWQLVLKNFNAAMIKAGISEEKPDGGTKTKDARAKSAILSQFWGGHQRFFNQVITSMQMPTVIRHVEKDLAEGRQAVLQLVNTNEAAQERALAKVKAEGNDEMALEDLDMSPRDQLLQLVQNAFPVGRFEEYEDESGNTRSRPVVDKHGIPVQDPALVEAREALLDELGSIRVPDGPLETVLNAFGVHQVAEVTGRKQRIVRKPDDKTGEMRTVVEKRPGSSNVVEADAFQEAKKPILVFSEAGGTGRSYHADIDAASAGKRRSHYLVQAGWRADKAVQGFGRTHRTNQASAPIFHLVSTDLQGQKRFISSIARRLGQLGALTKGERRTGDQGLFGLRDNLESDEAKQALKVFYSDVMAGNIEGVGLNELQDQMGLKLVEESTGRTLEDLPPMTQFLNRLLSLRVDMQNRVFNEFSRRMDDVIDRAAAAGTLDTGLETYRADKIVKRSEQMVYRDPDSGAETRHVHLETQTKLNPAKFADVVTRLRKNNKDGSTPFIVSRRSGNIFGVMESTPRTDTKTGEIFDQRRLISPTDYQFVDANRLNDDRYWNRIEDPKQQAQLWDKRVAKLPEYSKEDLHLITGAVLPIWDRLQGNPRIFRLQTDTGEKFLGRVIPNDSVNDTLKALGATGVKIEKSPSEVVSAVLDEGRRATLANGWTIKRALVAGEPRLELVGPDYKFNAQLKQDGVFVERISWDTRYFIPTGDEAPGIVAKIIRDRPITELLKPGEVSKEQRMPLVRDTSKFQRAYHGSPYDFDKFENHALGSGEAAHAFGYGHYFAGARAVADYYRSTVSAQRADIQAATKRAGLDAPKGSELSAAIYSHAARGDDPETAAKRIRWRVYGGRPAPDDAKLAAAVREVQKELKGKLYTVTLAPKADEWMDWDRPLSEQGPKVQAALEKIKEKKLFPTRVPANLGRALTGVDLYRHLTNELSPEHLWVDPATAPRGWAVAHTGFEGQPAASEALRQAGIPGIRYRDQNTRLAAAQAEAKIIHLLKEPETPERDAAVAEAKKVLAENTHNYVVFDPDHIRIDAKEQREAVGKNTGSLRGKQFWSGAFDTRDGHILEVHPYEKAAASDFHHNHYFSSVAIDAMEQGEASFFWMGPHGEINTEWREKAARPAIVQAIRDQLDTQARRETFGARTAPASMERLSHDVLADLPAVPTAEEQAIIDKVSRLASRMVPKADVVAARRLFATGGGTHEVAGAVTMGARRLIAWSLGSQDAIGTFRHESIHWLRHSGFFTGHEWATLERAARTGDWMGRWNIRERYPQLTFESQLEEAIADQFAYWRRGKGGIPEVARPLFERLAQLLGRVRDYLRQQFGHDVSADNIFQRIQSGEIGARTAADLAPPTPVFGKRGAHLQRMDASLFQKMDPEERDGRIAEATRSLISSAENFQMLLAPMASGGDTARATVKDFMDLIRASRDLGQFQIKQLGKKFGHVELRRMWKQADEESILRQQGVSDLRDRGLAKLDPNERAAVDEVQSDANSVWKAMIKAGQVKAEGLPSYVPHLYVEVGETGYRRLGKNRNVKSIPGVGRNVTTSSPHMKHRKYLTAEEGAEAAAKKFGVETAVLEDIRTLPLATMRNRMALAGYQLIETIKKMGNAVGEEWVVEGATPPGFFHIDNPSFFRWQPKLIRNEETGKTETALDQNGQIQWQKIPLSVHESWEGPMRAGLTEPESAAYRAFMDLKMRAMTNIMFSPLVQLHLMTELGRALPAAPGKILTTKLLFEGYRAKQDPATRLRFTMAGGVPVGRHGAMQDISSITETQNLVPGRSWTSQILAAVPGLFDRRAGDAVKRGTDRVGDLLHGTLLWDRVEDLQFGLFQTLADHARATGLSPKTADRLAAHQANRFAGTLPQESMSSFARKLSNIILFSRTYTLGNLGMFKDALGSLAGTAVNLVGRGVGRSDIGKSWGGLPTDVQAQIARDAPEELAKVQSVAKRKAIAMLAIDVGMIYGLSSLAQNFFQWMGGESGDEILQGYVGRWNKLVEDIKADPLLIANPFYSLMHLSPLWENETDPNTGMPLQRIFIGYDKQGTAVYARNPAGKYSEEIVNWTTAPLETLKSKLNALGVKPTLDIMHNDRGFGRKIWLPGDNAAQILGKIAAHYIEAVLPMNNIEAAHDLLIGKTKELDTQRLVGGSFGVTFRHGSPGGPAVGLMYQVRDRAEAVKREQMPDIMEQIKDGEVAEARRKMTQLGIRPRLQVWYIRVARNPRLRLSPSAMRDFNREATPEERAQMERLRGANQ